MDTDNKTVVRRSQFSDADIDALIDWFYKQLRGVGASADVLNRAPGAFATIVESSEHCKRDIRTTKHYLLKQFVHQVKQKK